MGRCNRKRRFASGFFAWEAQGQSGPGSQGGKGKGCGPEEDSSKKI